MSTRTDLLHGRDAPATLDAGRYYGAVGGCVATSTGALSEVIHAEARALPEHDHARAYFCMLVHGHYVETVRGQVLDYRPLDVVFHAAGVPHHDAIGPAGARFVCLELDGAALDAAGMRLRAPAALLPARVGMHMVGLYRHFMAGTLSPLVLESAAYVLSGEVGDDDGAPERRFPRWLGRCLAHMHDEPAQPVSVRALAADAGVHPVHLAREFRRRFGCTPGEYLHKVRVRAACAAILRDGSTLASIAAEAGFADQAHLCRVFKAEVGCTPSAFRAALRRRLH